MSVATGSEGYKVGIVGATGAVGEEIVGCLDKTNFNVRELKLFASARSAGTVKKTPMGDVTIEEFSLEVVSSVVLWHAWMTWKLHIAQCPQTLEIVMRT